MHALCHDLLADALDERVHDARVAEIIVAPRDVQQVLARQHLAGVGDHGGEELQLLVGQVDLLSADIRLERFRHDGKLRERESAGLRRGAEPTEHLLDTHRHLPRGEGLHDIIVRAELQSEHAVHFLVARGEHQDRRVACAADLPADVQPVHAGEHNVQHDEVDPAAAEQIERLLARVRRAHGDALGGEKAAEAAVDGGVIVADEHGAGLHRAPPSSFFFY